MAGFLSLSQTGQGFGLFKPDGTGVAKKSPRAEGGRGEVNLPIEVLTNPDRGSADFAQKAPVG